MTSRNLGATRKLRVIFPHGRFIKQNITLSLDKDLIRKARILAAERATSISKMIGDELAHVVEQAERFERARRRALIDLDAGFHLGGQGSVPRDELHER